MDSVDVAFRSSDLSAQRTQLLINAVIATAANILGCYLVAFKSPTTIGTYRWFLLDIVVGSFT